MQVMMQLVDPELNPELLRDLREWLQEDEGTCRLHTSLLGEPLAPGEMGGGLLEILEVGLLNKDLLIALLGASSAWLTARHSARRMKIRVRNGEHEVEIDGTTKDDLVALAEALMEETGS